MSPDEELADALESQAGMPENAGMRDRILNVAGRLRAKGKQGTVPPEIVARRGMRPETKDPDAPRGPITSEVPKSYQDVAKRGLERLGTGVDAGGQFINRAVNKGTLGYWDAGLNALSEVTGTRVGYSPDVQQKFQEDHPFVAGLGDAAGYVNPAGLPARLGAGIGRAVGDPITRAIASRVSGPAGRVAARGIGGMATGAGTGGAVAATESLAAGHDMADAATAGLAGMKTGAAVGAGVGTLAGVGGEAAAAMRARSPDIRQLDRYGLEPGPLPGKPVIRQDQSILSQPPGSASPTGVSRATPYTRGAASRAASDEITADMNARSYANNQRFGEMQQEAYRAQGHRPARVDDILTEIDVMASSPRTGGSTLGRLNELRDRIQAFGPNGTVRAMDLDGIRDVADDLARQERTAGASDVPLRQVSDMLRQRVYETAPQIGGLNQMQHDVLSGFSERRGLIDMPKGGERGAPTSDKTRIRVAKRISQSGEETKQGGVTTSGGETQAERMSQLGPPPTLPGAAVPQAPNNYQPLLEAPRLQLAQENLQINPPQGFSGAGGARELGARILFTAPQRLAYPLARRAGTMEVGGKGAAADALTGAIRRKKKKKEDRND